MIIWDFDENKNYIKIGKYKVLNKKDSIFAAKLLNDIENRIKLLLSRLKKFKNPEIKLLIETHFKLQEMQLLKDQGLIKFDGLNKPKNVINTKKQKIGPDGSLRAKSRVVFLTLRRSNGRLKKIEELYSLIAHELTHTALNHVTWRDDNHPKEFKILYKLLLNLLL
jgi:hypothetical protein|tara:strand:+ start:24 stop:521 length:498 start_codon:yes stop_codon:yes gene_type:complete